MTTKPDNFIAQDRDALYYPYIEIRDINWLKATLLCFPHVHRIVPSRYSLSDSDEIQTFRNVEGPRKKPLLIEEEPKYDVVDLAQSRLLAKIQSNYDLIHDKYSLTASRRGQIDTNKLFPIHEHKLIFNLLDFLKRRKLAWVPKDSQWFYLHPKLGNAVMSTIAVAIANDKGFDIVTDNSNVHHKVVANNDEEIFTELLGDNFKSSGNDLSDRADSIAELVMTTAFDLTRLSAQNIADLQKDGHDLRQFKNALMPIAASMPAINNPDVRAERLQESVGQVLEEWRKYKRSLPRFALDALFDASEVKFPEIAASVMLGATGLTLGLGAGLAVGLIAYSGVKIWRKYKENASSPYQYLSRIEKAGASLVLPPLHKQ